MSSPVSPDNMRSPALCWTGAYGPYIHVCLANRDGRTAMERTRSDTYSLFLVEDGAARYDGRSLELPVALLLPPVGPDDPVLEIPRAATWAEVRFDAVHQPRILRRPRSGGRPQKAWRHADGAMRPQPDPLRVWGRELPRLLPTPLLERTRTCVGNCCTWWWQGRWGGLAANHELGGWLLTILQTCDADGVVSRTGTAGEASWLADLERFARDRIGQGIGVDALAAHIGYSRQHLHRRLLAATGRTPRDWLTDLRMEIALERLADPALSIAEVARWAGYRSTPSFHQAFRRRIGLTPQEWRRRRHRAADAR